MLTGTSQKQLYRKTLVTFGGKSVCGILLMEQDHWSSGADHQQEQKSSQSMPAPAQLHLQPQSQTDMPDLKAPNA